MFFILIFFTVDCSWVVPVDQVLADFYLQIVICILQKQFVCFFIKYKHFSLFFMHVSSIRLAKHAGSWYPAQKGILQKQVEQFFQNAKKQFNIQPNKVKAIIGPHAGYRYSGPTAAWSYQYLQKHPSQNLRIFLLGPSHHKYFEGCSLSNMEQLQTPFGNLTVDKQCIKQLKETIVNTQMSKKQEQKQHSIQMHLPLIKRSLDSKNKVKVIPIIVGIIDQKLAQQYGKRLSKYFDDQNTVFIVSSDFCHWGPHFSYQPYKQGKQIHEHISQLDHSGMNLIQKNDTKGFDKYIDQTSNTICGQFPIRILMHTIKNSKHSKQLQTKFVKYNQSEQVKSFNGSSVSYAAGVTYFK